MSLTRVLCALAVASLLAACAPAARTPAEPHTAAPTESTLGSLEEVGPISPTGLITLSTPLSEESVVLVFFSGHQCAECLDPVGRTERVRVAQPDGARFIVVDAVSLPAPLRAACVRAITSNDLETPLTYEGDTGLWMLGPTLAFPSGCAAGLVTGAAMRKASPTPFAPTIEKPSPAPTAPE